MTVVIYHYDQEYNEGYIASDGLIINGCGDKVSNNHRKFIYITDGEFHCFVGVSGHVIIQNIIEDNKEILLKAKTIKEFVFNFNEKLVDYLDRWYKLKLQQSEEDQLCFEILVIFTNDLSTVYSVDTDLSYLIYKDFATIGCGSSLVNIINNFSNNNSIYFERVENYLEHLMRTTFKETTKCGGKIFITKIKPTNVGVIYEEKTY